MNTKIAFRGLEISVGDHDRWNGCHKRVVPASILVKKDGEEVSFHLPNEAVTGEGIVDGEVLYGILRQISRQNPVGEIRLPLIQEGDAPWEW